VTAATKPIPLAQPVVGEREVELVSEVLRSGRLSLGPLTERFEEELAAYVGAGYGAAVSSGTAGLHLCMHTVGLVIADEVITSPFSFVASANCIIYEGGVPVFADIDPRTLNLDPAAVEAAITPLTKAIVAVDIFGYPCELDPLREICDKHGLALVEDSCEALGAEYKGRRLGSHGHPAAFAFYPNKQLTTGEGGMIVTDDEQQQKLFKSLANQGRADGGGWLEHARFGFNYRLDEVASAIGLAQLEKLDEMLADRAAVAARYTELLAGVDVEPPLADDDDHRRSWFVYVVKLPEGCDREAVIAALERDGVATSRYLPSIHLQPYMRERYGFSEGLCPVSEATSRRTLALPFFPQLEREDQERVVESLRAALG